MGPEICFDRSLQAGSMGFRSESGVPAAIGAMHVLLVSPAGPHASRKRVGGLDRVV